LNDSFLEKPKDYLYLKISVAKKYCCPQCCLRFSESDEDEQKTIEGQIQPRSD
jgi:hypothetical protein